MLKGHVSDTNIRLLRIFKAVVECGGFTAAEVELNISRSAISLAISDLEHRLGLRLCQRGRSGFSLTEEGATVYDSTLQLLGSLETFRTEVNALHDDLRGELNIGITDNLVTIPHMRITRALAELHEQAPSVKINIKMIPPKDVEIEVLDGRLHIGVIPKLRPLAGLNYLPLYDEESQLYCSREHPLFLQNDDDITQEQLAQFDAVVPAYAQTAEIKGNLREMKAAATATDREGIAFLLLTGQYIGYLPTHYAQQWVEQGRLRAVHPDSLKYVTGYSAITRRGARKHVVLEAFLLGLVANSREPS